MEAVAEKKLELVYAPVKNGQLRKIVLDGEEIGKLHYQSLVSLTTNILDDVDDDEAEVMFPIFRNYQFQNGYYIHELELFIDYRRRGLGQEVIQQFQKEKNSPILLYSLREAEEFWIKMGFANRESYYYTWEPCEKSV